MQNQPVNRDALSPYREILTKVSLVSLTASVQKFITNMSNAIFENLREHRFIAKVQAKYLNEFKENLAEDQALCLA